MRILQINSCHYRRGGADIVYLNTIQLLRERGNYVIEFSQKNDKNEHSEFADSFVRNYEPLKQSLFQKIIQSPRWLYSFESSRKLGKLIKMERPDIAHIHLYKGNLTASILLVLRKFRIPICITLHDYNMLCPRSIFIDGDNHICETCISSSTINCVLKRCNRKNLLYSIANYLEYFVNNNLFKPRKYYDKIISVSKFNLEKHSVRSDIQNKLVHLYNFFPGCERTKPNFDKGEYFLFFGRLSREKGLNTLFSAFRKISSNIKLKVVGTGNLEVSLKKRIANERLTNIDMLGYKSGSELRILIEESSFIIVPSEWYENNPMTIVEGYSYGKPVIGSRIGGIPELIIENETGFIFEMANVNDLAEKIQKAASLSINEYNKLSFNARDFALNNFSEGSHYKRLIDIYFDMKRNSITEHF